MRVLLALGGNAMTNADGRARPEDQIAAAEVAMEAVAELVADDVDVVVTHGNGPQVGNLLVKNELAAAVVPPVPLDWCGAQTQGTLGFVLMNALDAALAGRGIDRRRGDRRHPRPAWTADDAGFTTPTKPIGRFLPAEEAAVLVEHGETWEDRGEKGWRRVVASPEPLRGRRRPGGARAGRGRLRRGRQRWRRDPGRTREPTARCAGVEAVIDKDLGAALLARTVEADVLVIATDVPQRCCATAPPRPSRSARHRRELRAYAAAGPLRRRLDGPQGRRGLPVRRARAAAAP